MSKNFFIFHLVAGNCRLWAFVFVTNEKESEVSSRRAFRADRK